MGADTVALDTLWQATPEQVKILATFEAAELNTMTPPSRDTASTDPTPDKLA